MWACIRSDVAQGDNIFGVQVVDEGSKAVVPDVAYGQHQGLDPRWGEGQEGVQRHCRDDMPDEGR